MFNLLFYFLFKKLDGPISDKFGPSGPIGKNIKNINKNLKPYNPNFRRIPNNLPANLDASLFKDKEDLSLLFKLMVGVSTGVIDISPLKEMPEMSNVRWYTAFVRILREFVQEENPSEELIILVTYILQECLIIANFNYRKLF